MFTQMNEARQPVGLAVEDRLQWLSQQLEVTGAVTITSAATALAVSEMTIRRDLVELEGRGVARRVRGGARVVGPISFSERHDTAKRAKTRIAAKLSELVPAAGVVAFDASSTVMRLTSSLGGARDLTVLTNGPDTFAALQDLPGVEALLTGGRRERRTGSLVGPLACRTAQQIAVKTFFASASGLDVAMGAQELTLDEADVKRAIADGADEVVLAVDSSKLGATATALAIEWERIDILVTELAPKDRRLDPYRHLAQIL
jgi:DeoR family fructose operon transcriptional repressor